MADKLNTKSGLFLGIDDIAAALSISRESAKVTASRYVKKGKLFRLKKDFYITPSKINTLKEEELFRIANFLQIPSYISLLSALSFYNISTQQQRNFVESVSLKRKSYIEVKNFTFTYTLIKRSMYEGFESFGGRADFFIAKPDKALADIIYLSSMGRYNCDYEAVDFKKINKKNIAKYLLKSNDRAKLYWNRLCSSYKI